VNIFDLENKYKEELEQIEEWALLRIALGHKLKNAPNKNSKSSKSSFSKKVQSYLKVVIDSFYGFKNWFRGYDYIVFSDSSQRKIIDNRYFDKNVDYLINELSKDKTLLIELPNSDHYSLNRIETKHIVSENIPFVLSRLLALFVRTNWRFRTTIDNILLKERIYFDYYREVKIFKASYIIYNILLKIYRPKVIIVSCAYCKLGLVKVAKEHGIKVVEIQHGVINEQHFAYVSSITINEKFTPDVLLSFGKNEAQLKNRLIQNVYPVGSFYLEYLNEEFRSNSDLMQLIQRYKIVIGVSLQHAKWEEEAIFDFLVKVAEKNRNFLFLALPKKGYVINFTLPENIIIFDKLDCYQTIMHCDIHSTLYSTCALEAPSLGIPNILINSNNKAKEYYQNILSPLHTSIVEDEESFINSIKDLRALTKESIIEGNENVFVSNYKENIKAFVARVKEEKIG